MLSDILQWIRSLVFNLLMYLVMAVMAVALAPLVLLDGERAFQAVHLYCRYVRWSARWLVGLRSEVRGEVPLDEVLVAAKHQSFFDIILIVSALPRPKFIMKKELLWAPFLGWYAKRIGCIPVDRGKRSAAVEQMLKDVAAGRARPGQLIIYPQGTRVAPGQALPYKIGTALLYAELGQPCVPAATNVGVFWPRRGILRRPGLAVVEFLPRIPPDSSRARSWHGSSATSRARRTGSWQACSGIIPTDPCRRHDRAKLRLARRGGARFGRAIHGKYRIVGQVGPPLASPAGVGPDSQPCFLRVLCEGARGMRGLSVALAFAGALSLPAIGSAAVVNGGFEMDPGSAGLVNGNAFGSMPGAGGNASWDVWTDLAGASGWRTTAGTGIELQTASTLGLNPHEGSYYAELDSHANRGNSATNSTMEQDVFLTSGRYALSFWYSPRTANANDNSIAFSLGGLVAGVANGPSGGPPATSVGQWTEYVSLFDVITDGSYTLRFAATGTQNSYGGFLDAISIEAAPVPLPASLLLLAGGLGGLGLVRRRRRG